jgi:murein DD-endopeptidase MepM/ murein hydrolase activator NlpD
MFFSFNRFLFPTIAVIVILTIIVIAPLFLFNGIFSLKSADEDLTQAYLYLTELDVNFAEKIFTLPTESSFSGITTWQYSLNDIALSATPSATSLQNNLDDWMIYLDIAYQDYQFASISATITDLYHTLNTYRADVSSDDPTLATLALIQIPLADYLVSHADQFPPSAAERLQVSRQAGTYANLKKFTSPYFSTTPTWMVSSRFGYRFHPVTATIDQHLGLDIPMPEGTPIHAVYQGKVTIPSPDPDGYGTYLKITDSKHTFLYAHLNSLNVTDGQIVAQKDVIGFTGSTGDSTGSHLHLEYHFDSSFLPGDTKILNPQFYVQDDPTSSPAATLP